MIDVRYRCKQCSTEAEEAAQSSKQSARAVIQAVIHPHGLQIDSGEPLNRALC